MNFCDVSGCEARPTVDFGKHITAVGVPGLVRRLCCHHARGLHGHTRQCDCTAAQVARDAARAARRARAATGR